MWDFATRFPFGEQSAPLHNERTLDPATATLLLQRQGASHKTTPSSSYQHITNSHRGHTATAEHVTSVSNSPCISPNDVSFADVELPSIDAPSPTMLNTNMARWAFESERHKFKAKQETLRKTQPQRESCDFRLANDTKQPISEHGSEAKLMMEAEQFAQSATHLTLTTLEHTEMENLLRPVFVKLQSLKGTTPDSLPPYNSRLRAKNHLQVLKTRLLPVGKHILHVLSHISEGKRGLLELKLCRHIAVKYWPLPLEATTHLQIQEMYHNGMFTTSSQIQAETVSGVPVETSEDKQSSVEAQGGTPTNHFLIRQSSSDDQQNIHPLLEIGGIDERSNEE